MLTPYDKRARDVLRKLRKAIGGVASPGTLPEPTSDIDKETAALVKAIKGLQPKPSKSELPIRTAPPLDAVECPVCKGEAHVPSRLPGRTKSCPRCLGRGWVRPTPK